MKRNITKVAVLGSGIMGSRIACHFANIGLDVLLLDIIPGSLNEQEMKKGQTISDKAVRNRIVNDSLQAAIKSNPSPLYSTDFALRIRTGNFDDDLPKIHECDWVIEKKSKNTGRQVRLSRQILRESQSGRWRRDEARIFRLIFAVRISSIHRDISNYLR